MIGGVGLSFVMDVGSNGTLRSVVWEEGQSRTTFHRFSDVLVFDVT